MSVVERVRPIVESVEKKVIAYRRDFHRYAESGWTEFRTASLVARRLSDLGYEVHVGREVIQEQARMGVPPDEVLDQRWERAVQEGGDRAFLDAVRGGFTGVVGVLRCGPGPTVGLRFDMDALDIGESGDADHRPAREGFASLHEEAMHACGHDAHTAVGLGLAEVLVQVRDVLQGTVKLLFQPAEEGVRGAKAMVAAGVVDDVQYLLGHHFYSRWPRGEIAAGMSGYLATDKFDVLFRGAPAHAAGNPQEGRNALLAAATAVLNLYALSRHRDGATRVNVGRLVAGTGRNVVCAEAHLAVETRGATTELSEYMYDSAVRVLEGAAAMHGCTVEIRAMGGAQSASSDPALMVRVEKVAQGLDGLRQRAPEAVSGSEDFTYMMTRVQQNGGLATNIGIGADLGGWGHHTAEFDLDESAFKGAMELLACVVLDVVG